MSYPTPDSPIELPDGTLLCGRHHLDFCTICCVDYTFVHQDSDNESDLSSQGKPVVDRESRMQSSKRTRCAVCRKPANKKCSRCKSVYYCSVEHQHENWQTHKSQCVRAKPAEASTSKPRLLLIAVGGSHEYVDTSLDDLCVRLEDKMTISRAVEAKKAERLLKASIRPSAVIVGDRISPKHQPELLDAIVQYVQTGGTVIFGAGFPSFTRPPDIDEIFNRIGLPWKSGDYKREEFSLVHEKMAIGSQAKSARSAQQGVPLYNTPKEELAERMPSPMPERYDMKALHLRDVITEQAIYLDVQIGRREREQKGRLVQTPVAFASVGSGWVGYLGDVNAGGDGDSELVLQAMIGPRVAATRSGVPTQTPLSIEPSATWQGEID